MILGTLKIYLSASICFLELSLNFSQILKVLSNLSNRCLLLLMFVQFLITDTGCAESFLTQMLSKLNSQRIGMRDGDAGNE